MKELKMFEQREVLGKELNVYGDYENPLFLAKDVAEWIEYSDGNVSHMCSMVDEDEKIKIFCTLSPRNNGTKPVIEPFPSNKIFLKEDGVYEVLMQSRKPIAKEFKKKVKELLKEIRKKHNWVLFGENRKKEANQHHECHKEYKISENREFDTLLYSITNMRFNTGMILKKEELLTFENGTEMFDFYVEMRAQLYSIANSMRKLDTFDKSKVKDMLIVMNGLDKDAIDLYKVNPDVIRATVDFLEKPRESSFGEDDTSIGDKKKEYQYVYHLYKEL